MGHWPISAPNMLNMSYLAPIAAIQPVLSAVQSKLPRKRRNTKEKKAVRVLTARNFSACVGTKERSAGRQYVM